MLNDAELGVVQPNIHGYRLAKVPWSPHNMFADMYVARAPWHVVFCWLMGGTGGGGVGAEEGGWTGKQVSLNPTLGSNP